MKKLTAFIVVILGSMTDAITSAVLDGREFNFGTGLKRLLCIAVMGGLIALGSWIIANSKKD